MKFAAINSRTGQTCTADTLVELVSQYATVSGNLVTLKGCKPVEVCSYTSDWTEDEKQRDRAAAIAHLDSPWKVFRLSPV